MGATRQVRTDRTRARCLTSLVVGLLGVCLAREAVGDALVWDQAHPTTSPGPRREHAATYDAVRGHSLIFGGRWGTTERDDLWAWTGVWTRLAPTDPARPSRRFGAAMAFDGTRNNVVLFGGRSGVGATGTIFRDTYVWNGVNWTLVGTGGPPPRYGHTLVYDPDNQRIVLFGGRDQSGLVPADLWTWNGTTWTSTPTTGGPPDARALHSMAYDAAGKQLVLYGGLQQALTTPGDTWVLRGTTWVPICTTASCFLPSRLGHALASDVNRRRALLFAGSSGSQSFNAIWDWDTATSKWNNPALGSPPAPRQLHSFTYDTNRKRFVLYGGLGTSELGDTWELYWTGQPCSAPSDCATGFCVDGVCCREPCTGPCRRCDQANPASVAAAYVFVDSAGNLVVGPGVAWIDGVCRQALPRSDPDGDCGGEGNCRGSCSREGRCDFPGSGTLCARCTACDGKGGCKVLPLNYWDGACPELQCSKATTQCRTYRNVRRCRQIGECSTTWGACNDFTNTADGTACSSGTCKAGFCLP
jgi:hypothetical protein